MSQLTTVLKHFPSLHFHDMISPSFLVTLWLLLPCLVGRLTLLYLAIRFRVPQGSIQNLLLSHLIFSSQEISTTLRGVITINAHLCLRFLTWARSTTLSLSQSIFHTVARERFKKSESGIVFRDPLLQILHS